MSSDGVHADVVGPAPCGVLGVLVDHWKVVDRDNTLWSSVALGGFCSLVVEFGDAGEPPDGPRRDLARYRPSDVVTLRLGRTILFGSPPLATLGHAETTGWLPRRAPASGPFRGSFSDVGGVRRLEA